MANRAILQLCDIHKSYGAGTPVLNGVDLDVAGGEILCLLGPSGCGKTTLLRVIAGLEQVDRGTVYFENKDLAQVAVHQRNFGFMFQDFALFPHRTVGQNIAFGLKMARRDSAAIDLRVSEMMTLIDLPSTYRRRSIFELSGGERQRVALARSLAPNPQLLMLDEPLGNLDRGLRQSLAIELRHILKKVGVTAVYVTHDQEEAYALSDRIGVMNRGRLLQVGSPQQLYQTPNSAFVARFLGLGNLLQVEVDATAAVVASVLGNLPLERLSTTPLESGKYLLLVRPQAAMTGRDEKQGVRVDGTVVRNQFQGDSRQVTLRVGKTDNDSGDLTLEVPGFRSPELLEPDTQIGTRATVMLDPNLMQLLPVKQ